MHVVLIETSGNQAFIFTTNKLRENVGASELTYRAGTQYVLEAVRRHGGPELWSDEPKELRKNLCDLARNKPISSDSPIEVIMATSGKALLLVQDQVRAQEIVAAVTRRGLQEAPGLDILGVVSGGFDWGKCSLHQQVKTVHEEYEELRGSRSGPVARFPMMPIFAPCESSGRPASGLGKEGERRRALSRESLTKRDAAALWHRRVGLILHGSRYWVPKSLKELEEFEERYRRLEWLAVVHADGNGLGKVFLNFEPSVERAYTEDCKTHGGNRTYVNKLREFSVALEDITQTAFIGALNQLNGANRHRIHRDGREYELLPVVPLVLGGDDLTVLCDGKAALPFARSYLEGFEKGCGNNRSGVVARIGEAAQGCPRFSSCAGVAIIKPHFPFHSAYELSEQLLRSAKEVKKRVIHVHADQETPYPCSAVDFHLLYDATFSDLDTIRERLMVDKGETRLTAKPYVVTRPQDIEGAIGRDWAEEHSWEELWRRIAAINAEEDGRRKLPNTQLHDLREGLFLGRQQADARMRLIRHRYVEQGLEKLLESGPSLFRSVTNEKHRYETRFLDSLEVAGFWR